MSSDNDALMRIGNILEDIASALKPRLPSPPALSAATVYRLVDALHQNQAAWEGEEESVQDEKEYLMTANVKLIDDVRKELDRAEKA